MRVTTGGLTYGAGTLIVGTLVVAAVLTVRDENNGQDECQPQAFPAARAASKSFENEYIDSSDDASGAKAVVVVPSDDARDLLDKGAAVPDWSDKGYVVIVDHDRAADDTASLPSCFEDTPILYMSPDRVTG